MRTRSQSKKLSPPTPKSSKLICEIFCNIINTTSAFGFGDGQNLKEYSDMYEDYLSGSTDFLTSQHDLIIKAQRQLNTILRNGIITPEEVRSIQNYRADPLYSDNIEDRILDYTLINPFFLIWIGFLQYLILFYPS